MITTERGMGTAVAGMCLVLACQTAVESQPRREPTRQIEERMQRTPGRPRDERPTGAPDRQRLRTIPERSESTTPRIDTETGTFELRRELRVRPPRRGPSRVAARWRLGVWTEMAPRGVRVREVSRYSPAWRYGLEEGDYLLDIMGYPVGLYEGAYYPVSETLNQVTPPDGWINILVWNKRTWAEESMWIQAERRIGYTIGEPGD